MSNNENNNNNTINIENKITYSNDDLNESSTKKEDSNLNNTSQNDNRICTCILLILKSLGKFLKKIVSFFVRD